MSKQKHGKRYSETEIVRILQEISGGKALAEVARSTARYRLRRADDPELVAVLQATAQQHPVYGYRPVTALLRRQGWQVTRNGSTVCGSRQDSSSGGAGVSSAASVRQPNGSSAPPVPTRSGAMTSSV